VTAIGLESSSGFGFAPLAPSAMVHSWCRIIDLRNRWLHLHKQKPLSGYDTVYLMNIKTNLFDVVAMGYNAIVQDPTQFLKSTDIRNMINQVISSHQTQDEKKNSISETSDDWPETGNPDDWPETGNPDDWAETGHLLSLLKHPLIQKMGLGFMIISDAIIPPKNTNSDSSKNADPSVVVKARAEQLFDSKTTKKVLCIYNWDNSCWRLLAFVKQNQQNTKEKQIQLNTYFDVQHMPALLNEILM
jgi:hypothetical protein